MTNFISGLKLIFASFSIYLLALSCSQNKDLVVNSPDGKTLIAIQEINGHLYYKISWNGKPMLDSSRVTIFPGKKVRILESTFSKVNKIWKPVWGQFSEVRNNYNELKVLLDYEGIPSNLIVRAYDHGLGFRFLLDQNPRNAVPNYHVEYKLTEKNRFYMPQGEGAPIGPIVIDSLIASSDQALKWQMPLLVQSAQGPNLAFLESDLFSSQGFEVINFRFSEEKQCIIAENPHSGEERRLQTPWRVILIEEELGDLSINQVPLNLAPPRELKDASWIKPGKALWDWRVHGFTAPDGFTYGINTESYLRFIDFASKNQIEYFLIDDSWYTDVSKKEIRPSSKLDLERIANYAAEKGVALMLYYDRRKGDYGDSDLFPFYKSLGMKGIKYGFMGSDLAFTRAAIVESAKSKLLINFHDNPVPLTGVSRTFPNAITREYNHAQQDARRTFTPETFIKMALINAIQGPMDMNNGIFDILGTNAGKREKGPKIRNSLVTTVVAELARILIIHSGIVCLPDAPEAYEAKSDLFEFIKNLPIGKWDESRIINAKMGEYITTARRSGNDWFVGSVSSVGGQLEIPVDFLEEKKNYTVTFYEDTKKTNSLSNPEAYQIREDNISSRDIIQAYITKGGGHCMWIKQI